MQTLSLGQIELGVLDDGTWPFPARFLFRDVPQAAWREQVATDPEGRIPVGHNYGLVKTRDDLTVIDTGYGDDTHGGRTGHLLAELHRAGYAREQVTRVINTHAHGDHIKRNTVIQHGERRPTFPNAHYFLGREDWHWFNGPPGKIHEFDQQIVAINRFGLLQLVDSELQLSPEISLLRTPGHTPGHTSVAIRSRGRTAIYLGDVCHHPLHFSHPDWVSTFDTHPEVTPRTRAQLFAFAVAHDALLICPHAPYPGLGHLRQINEGFVWQPVA